MWKISITLVVYSLALSKCQSDAAFQGGSLSSPESLSSNEPIRIKMLAPTSVSKKHTRTRQNSRFLRTFPPMELLNLAKQSAMNNEISPLTSFSDGNGGGGGGMSYHEQNPFISSHSRNDLYGGSPPVMSYGKTYPTKARIEAGNSPIFYIKLPPVPYVFMPGVGYISPHPYSNSPSMPLATSSGMMSGMDSFLPGLGQDLSSSMEQSQVPPSVISLPLKFLSNGRPHQIESPKKKKRPGNKENSSESNKGAALISGGKYSFNGRPTAVFVVRSPATRK